MDLNVIRNEKFPEEPLKSEIFLSSLFDNSYSITEKFSVLILVCNQTKIYEGTTFSLSISFALYQINLFSNCLFNVLYVLNQSIVINIEIYTEIFLRNLPSFTSSNIFFSSLMQFFLLLCDLRLRRRPNQIKKIERGKIY